MPTNRGRYQGHFRTGKRLDMRAVLNFIASDYRKGRIWLRRSRISKRGYEVILAVDNSCSMSELGVHRGAVEGMIVVSSAMKKLEVGNIGIVTFGNAQLAADGTASGLPQSRIVLNPGDILSPERGQSILDDLTFAHPVRDGFNKSLPELLNFLCHYYEGNASGSAGSTSVNRLVIILSDGRFNHSELIIPRQIINSECLSCYALCRSEEHPSRSKDSSLQERKRRSDETNVGPVNIPVLILRRCQRH